MNWSDIGNVTDRGILFWGENKTKMSMPTTTKIALDIGGICFYLILDALQELVRGHIMYLCKDRILEAGVHIIDVSVGLDHGDLFSEVINFI